MSGDGTPTSPRARSLPRLAVVVPCFDEEATVSWAAPILREVLTALEADGSIAAWSLVLVDDGSRDATWARIEEQHRLDGRTIGLRLAVNTGHQAALLAGMAFAVRTHDAVVTIDADLQDDVEAIAEMVRHHRRGADVVLGVREGRDSDSWFKRGTARLFYALSKRLGVPLVPEHADFRLLSRGAVLRLLEFPERNMFLRALVSRIGSRPVLVGYVRSPRTRGTSKYPLRRMISFALDGITSFSVVPLRIVSALGFIGLAVAAAATVVVLVGNARGETIQGWTSTILVIAFIGSFQILGIGLLGEYVARIYLETKQRPRYQVESTLDGTGGGQPSNPPEDE